MSAVHGIVLRIGFGTLAGILVAQAALLWQGEGVLPEMVLGALLISSGIVLAAWCVRREGGAISCALGAHDYLEWAEHPGNVHRRRCSKCGDQQRFVPPLGLGGANWVPDKPKTAGAKLNAPASYEEALRRAEERRRPRKELIAVRRPPRSPDRDVPGRDRGVYRIPRM